MEEYRASIANVDTALNRLNQTLASYKIFAAESQKNKSRDSVQRDTPAEKNLQGLDASKLPSQAATLPQNPRTPSLPPLRKEIVDGILALRSSKSYPEVRQNMLVGQANTGRLIFDLRKMDLEQTVSRDWKRLLIMLWKIPTHFPCTSSLQFNISNLDIPI